MPACLFCGDPEYVALAEVWGHDFQIDACCESLLQQALRRMEGDPDYATALVRSLAEEAGVCPGMRRVADTGLSLQIDHGLKIRPISRRDAMTFIARHHRHVGRLPGDRFRAAVWNGPTMLGVVVVGNPTARGYNGQGIVEVRRLCLDLAISDALRWKACSALYAWAAHEAERRGWRKIITYTLASESGMSLRYARWKREGETARGARSWANRPGRVAGPAESKVRWSKALTPPRQGCNTPSDPIGGLPLAA